MLQLGVITCAVGEVLTHNCLPPPQGKAAIDVICNPLGKSGGALIQQFMILGFGSLAASTPYLGAILLMIVLAWIAAAKDLAVQFADLQRQTEGEKVASEGGSQKYVRDLKDGRPQW